MINNKYIAILVALISMVSCGIDDTVIGTGNIDFSVDVTIPEYENTPEETKSELSYVVRLTWKAGDKASVVNLSTNKILGGQISADADGTTTKFTGTLNGTVRNGDELMLIYPAQTNASETNCSSISLDFSNQDGSSSSNVFFAGYIRFKANSTNGSITVSTAANTLEILTSYLYMGMSNLPKSKDVKNIVFSGFPNKMNLTWNATSFAISCSSVMDGNITLTSSNSRKTGSSGSLPVYFTTPEVASNNASERKAEVRFTDNSVYSSTISTSAKFEIGKNYRNLLTRFTRTDQTSLSVSGSYPRTLSLSSGSGTFDTSRSWKSGDAVSVVNLTTGELLKNTLTASAAGSSATFTGSVLGDKGVNSGDKLLFLYPAVGNTEYVDFTSAPIIYDIHSAQDGKLANVPVILAAEGTYNNSTVTVSSQFKQVTSLAKITANLSGCDTKDTVDQGTSGSGTGSGSGNSGSGDVSSGNEGFGSENGDWGDVLSFTPSTIELNVPTKLMISYNGVGQYRMDTVSDGSKIVITNPSTGGVTVNSNVASAFYVALPVASGDGASSLVSVTYFNGDEYYRPAAKWLTLKGGTYYDVDYPGR